MDISSTLRKIGFTEYEIKIFISLASLNTATAGEIAKQSKVPRNKVYEALDKLSKEGFLMELNTKPMKFKILSFEKLSEVVLQKKKEIESLQKETDDAIQLLENIPSYSEKKEVMWVIKGQQNIVEKIAYETKNVKKEALACVRSIVDHGTGIRNTLEATKRGVTIKIICEVKKENLHKVKKLIDAGVQIRIYDEKKFGVHGMRFSVFDGKTSRITIGKPEVESSEDYATVWSESKSMANLLKRQFEWMWNEAKPFALNKK